MPVACVKTESVWFGLLGLDGWMDGCFIFKGGWVDAKVDKDGVFLLQVCVFDNLGLMHVCLSLWFCAPLLLD